MDYPKDQFAEIIEELKKERTSPIFILGGAELARKIAAFLYRNGLDCTGFLIDQPYYENGSKNILDKPVYETAAYLAANKAIVIVGHAGFALSSLPPIARRNIKRLYCLDFIGHLLLGEKSLDEPWDEAWCRRHEKELGDLFSSLADDKSRSDLEVFLQQRMHGNYSKPYDENQYFPAEIIKLQDGEVFVDCGAFRGETAADFIKRMSGKNLNYKKIIMFEPDAANAAQISRLLDSDDRISVEVAGVWSETGELHFQAGNGTSSAISDDGEETITVKSIDDVLAGQAATYIKMDIEGSELMALRGAAKTIAECKPKLAISLYHKREDLLTIPQYVKSLNPDYNLYIRNHSSSGIELVLYAV